MAETWEEVVCIVLSFGLAGAYHVFFAYELWRHPYRISLGTNIQERLAWCVKVMSRSGNEILGVQSARNSMLASTLLASSVLVVAFEVVREFYLADEDKGQDGYQQAASSMCVIFLTGSFFCFVQSIRACNHLSFLICCHPWEIDTPAIELLSINTRKITLEDRIRIAGHTMKALTLYFSVAWRLMYLAVPCGLWLLGPWWLMGSMFSIIAFLALLDHGIL